MTTKPRLYIAAPLFSEAEKSYNKKLKTALRKYFEVWLPQEDGGLLVEMMDKGMSPSDAMANVFTGDMEAVDECDIFLIVMDGRTIDEGAMFELGVAYIKDKPCYGIQTDPRRLLPTGNNPMIMCALRGLFEDATEFIDWVEKAGLSDRDAIAKMMKK